MADRKARVFDENSSFGFSSKIRGLLLSAGLAVTLIAPAGALAQDIVGRGVIEGKVVQLFEDGTWRYAPTEGDAAQDCRPIALGVEFCSGTLGWKRLTAPPNGQITAMYEINARSYAQFIVEDLGAVDGLELEMMRQIILNNAEAGAGAPPAVIDVLPATLDGLTGETVIFSVKMNGLDLVFANSVFVEPKRSMQIMTYAIAREYKPEQAELQASLLANTKIAK